MLTYNQIFEKKQNILFVTAHPDDVIICFGALIHKLRTDSKNVFVVTVSNGARGSRENKIAEDKLAAIRIKEEVDALDFLKVPKENCICLNYKDGEVESDMKLIGEISKYIRKFKADIVCTHEPSVIFAEGYNKEGYFVQHRDHRKVGEAATDAVYPFSRDRSFFPEHYKESIEPHSLYDLLLTDEKSCNFNFDHTDVIETKRSAMRFHKSQFDENTVNEIVDIFKFDGRYMEKFNYLKLLW